MNLEVALQRQSARIGRTRVPPPPLIEVPWKEMREQAARASKGRQKQVRLAPTQVDDLVTSYKAGSTWAELAQRFGIDQSTVWAHLRRRGVKQRPYRKMDADLASRAVDLYSSGQSLRAIADELGRSRETIRSALLAQGVALRSRGTPPTQA